MRRTFKVVATVSIVVGLAIVGAVIAFYSPLPRTQGNRCSLRIVQSIQLPNSRGRIDHMDINVSNMTMYVAATANDSLAVVSLRDGRFVGSLIGFNQPFGVLYLPRPNELLVSNGGNGTVEELNGTTLSLLRVIQFTSDADNLRYDAGRGLVWVGYGGGAVAAVNLTTGRVLLRVDLAGHPESFQLEERGSRIFVNVPQGRYVAVADKGNGSIAALWPLPTNSSNNFAMALDENDARLFVATRNPSELLVYDTTSGSVIAKLPIAGDPDDVFYDGGGCIYVSAGQGYVDVVSQVGPNSYTLSEELPTAVGARTSLYVGQIGRLYVAGPGTNGTATLYVYAKIPS